MKYNLPDDNFHKIGEMMVETVAGGTYPLLNDVVDPFNIWDVFTFGGGVDTYIQKGKCAAAWFKFTIYTHLLYAEATLDMVILDLFP